MTGLWFLPFFLFRFKRPSTEPPARIDRRARWGIALEAAGFFIVYLHAPATWRAPIGFVRAIAGFACGLIAMALTWTAVGPLGKQWRVDAGLNPDHELVQTGAYRIVRHPIYASMVWLVLMGICWVGTLPGWPVGLALVIAGTEIRVRIEDHLLRERFGARFVEWQKRVPAYLPFLR
jgi:protein-S-isoprenylcysteine O-methyltransferase Ste14